MKVKNKVVVVTGAGSGMGREITLELVRRGAKVAAVDMREETLAETAKIAGHGVETFVLDVTNRADVARLPSKIEAKIGDVDILINNAGIGSLTTVEHETDEIWQKVLNVNVVGTARVSRAAIPLLRKSQSPAIVNTASIAARSAESGEVPSFSIASVFIKER